MRFNKNITVFSVILILMLSLNAVVRAAPPRDRSIASDNLDLNALEKAGLSDSLAGQDDPDDDTGGDDDEDDADSNDDGDDDDSNDDGDSSDDDGDTDGDGDDSDSDDDDDIDGDDVTSKKHPVAEALAEEFDVGYEQIIGLHEEGTGFGNLAKALFLAQMMEDKGNLPEYVNAIQQNGWGQIKKHNASHPGRVGTLGSIMRNAKKSAPEPDDPGDSIGATGFSQSSLNTSSNSNGNGHGKGKNEGKGNGKAKGKGKK